MSGKQILTSSSRSVKGALYGSLRRVGSIGKKKASRSKSVSNLQALFNPIDDSALSTSTSSVSAAPIPFDKENSEASLKYGASIPCVASLTSQALALFFEQESHCPC